MKTETTGYKPQPYFPVRLNPVNQAMVFKLQRKTGLNRATICRIGLEWVLPKMVSGEIHPYAAPPKK